MPWHQALAGYATAIKSVSFLTNYFAGLQLSPADGGGIFFLDLSHLIFQCRLGYSQVVSTGCLGCLQTFITLEVCSSLVTVQSLF